MSSVTFLRLEIVAHDGLPSPIMVNVDHIVRIHSSWPLGATIVTTDDASLHVTASLDEIRSMMTATNGRIMVKRMEPPVEIDPVYEAAVADLQP